MTNSKEAFKIQVEDSNGIKLPFDPLRVLAAIVNRGKLIIASTLITAVLIGVEEAIRHHGSNISTAQLLREVRQEDSSIAFQPSQISASTLQILMTSPVILNRVAQETKISPKVLARRLTISPRHGTDIMDIEYDSPRGEDADKVLNTYGTQVINFTMELSANDAKDADRLLQQQAVSVEEDLAKANATLLKFCQDTKMIYSDKEIDSYLQEITDIDTRLQTTRIDYETVDLRIESLKKELMDFNSVQEQLLAARNHLSELQQAYAPGNPLVLAQQDLISKLVAESTNAPDLNKPMPKPRGDGTEGVIYEEMVKTKAEKEVLQSQVARLQAVHENMVTKLQELSDNTIRYDAVHSRQQALQASQATLMNRQREAALYSITGLSNYRFIPGTTNPVSSSELLKKAGLRAILAGAFIGFLLTARFSYTALMNRRVVTNGDAKRVLDLPILGQLDNANEPAVQQWAFRTWIEIQSQLDHDPFCLGVISAQPQEGKSIIIKLLQEAALLRTNKIITLTNAPVTNGTSLDNALSQPAQIATDNSRWITIPSNWQWTLDQRAAWQSAAAEWVKAGYSIIIELPCAEKPAATLLATTCSAIIWIIEADKNDSHALSLILQPFKALKCKLIGAILNRSKPIHIPFSN